MNDQRWKSCFQAPCNAPSYSHHQSNTEAWLNNRGIILFQMLIFSLDSIFGWVCGCWVTKSCPCMQPQGLKHSRLPCPSPSPGVCSNSCPLSWWCHPIISSSCLQSFPASGSFPIGWLLTSGGQSTGASASHQSFQWIFSVDFLEDWLWAPCCPRDSQESSPTPQFKSINSLVLSLLYGPTLTSILDLEKPQLWLDRPLAAKWCVFFLICCLGLS